MNQKFKSSSSIIWVFIYPTIPMMDLLVGRPLDKSIFIKVFIWLAVALILYKYHNRLVAEIKDNEIYFYEGVGITAPNSLEISRITLIERLSKKMLKIKYDEDKVFSIETDKKVLNKIEKSLKSLMK